MLLQTYMQIPGFPLNQTNGGFSVNGVNEMLAKSSIMELQMFILMEEWAYSPDLVLICIQLISLRFSAANFNIHKWQKKNYFLYIVLKTVYNLIKYLFVRFLHFLFPFNVYLFSQHLIDYYDFYLLLINRQNKNCLFISFVTYEIASYGLFYS